jgi:hypothetical protein
MLTIICPILIIKILEATEIFNTYKIRKHRKNNYRNIMMVNFNPIKKKNNNNLFKLIILGPVTF